MRHEQLQVRDMAVRRQTAQSGWDKGTRNGGQALGYKRTRTHLATAESRHAQTYQKYPMSHANERQISNRGRRVEG